MDPDSDGDGVLDGWDDQDHDDFSNVQELQQGTWAMNPCDPVFVFDAVGNAVLDEDGGPISLPRSRTCPRWMVPEEAPRRPKHECFSRTLLVEDALHENVGRDAIPWLQDDDKEPAAEGPQYCETYF
jgi:hypothetical protein